MTIGELMAMLADMDPAGEIKVYDPDPDEEGISYGRKIYEIKPLWTSEAHYANGKADILVIDLEK